MLLNIINLPLYTRNYVIRKTLNINTTIIMVNSNKYKSIIFFIPFFFLIEKKDILN